MRTKKELIELAFSKHFHFYSLFSSDEYHSNEFPNQLPTCRVLGVFLLLADNFSKLFQSKINVFFKNSCEI